MQNGRVLVQMFFNVGKKYDWKKCFPCFQRQVASVEQIGRINMIEN